MNKPTVVALIDALESELNNGGFDQFFFNDQKFFVNLRVAQNAFFEGRSAIFG